MNKNIFVVPVVIIIANHYVVGFLLPHGLLWDVVYNVIRAAAIGYAGWLVVRQGGGTLGRAALAGLLLFAIDHVVLRGGEFLFDAYVLKETPQENVSAFGGVWISFVLFAGIALAVAWIGGLAARRVATRR